MEISITFDQADAEDGVVLFARELPDEVSRTIQQSDEHAQEPGAKHPVLRSGLAPTIVVAVNSALLLLTPLAIWLGRGKKVTLRSGDHELTMENMTTDEMERMLAALDRRD